MVRREPGEVVDGAAQGHEHVLALDVAAEHRARGPGRREARWASLYDCAPGLSPAVCAAWAVGSGYAATTPASRRCTTRHVSSEAEAAPTSPPQHARRATCWAGRKSPSTCAQSPAGAAAAAGAGAARTSGRCSLRAARDPPPYPFQQQGREQRRQRVEQRPARGARPGQGFVVLALRRRERRERVELVGEARRRLEDGVARADEEEDEPALPVSRLPYQLVLDARALLVRVDEEAEHVLCRGAAMARGRCGVLLLLFWSWGQGGVIGLLPSVSTTPYAQRHGGRCAVLVLR